MENLQNILIAYDKINEIVDTLNCHRVKCTECPFDKNNELCDRIKAKE